MYPTRAAAMLSMVIAVVGLGQSVAFQKFSFDGPTRNTNPYSLGKHHPWLNERLTHRNSVRSSVYRSERLFISTQLQQGLSQWLPTCTDAAVTSVAIRAGIVGLLSQLILTFIFSRIRYLKKSAAYTAHTVIAMALMVVVSTMGVMGWWCCSDGSRFLTASARLLEPVASARWLAAVVTGIFACWDVPFSILIPDLRKPDVIVHHIAMTVVAAVAAYRLPMHYVFFYLGISESSSIPLLIYDQLSLLIQKLDIGSNDTNLELWRDRFQGVAGASFILIRALLFTKVTMWNFVPDVLSVLPAGGKPLQFAMYASIGFTVLQLYWFSRILGFIFFGQEPP